MAEIAPTEGGGIVLVTTREGRMVTCQAFRDGEPRSSIWFELAEGDQMPSQQALEECVYILVTTPDRVRARKERAAARRARFREN